MEYIEQIDQQLLIWLNNAGFEALDPTMVFLTYRFTWIPFYAVLLFFLLRKKSLKEAVLMVVTIALLVIVTDQVSNLLKFGVERYRPCHNLEIQSLLRLPDGCGGQFGFWSAHASNSFAIAVFTGLALSRKWLVGLVIWATVVAYTRIYLGVHYPLDILAGGVAGMIFGVLFFQLYSAVNHTVSTK